MNRIKRWLVGISLAVLVVLTILVLIVYLATSDLCVNEKLSASISPSGEYKAITFRRNCGATTPYSVQVSVVPAGMELPNEAGNVVVVREDLTPEVRWNGPYELEVRYPGYVDVGIVDKMPNDVSIFYSPVTE